MSASMFYSTAILLLGVPVFILLMLFPTFIELIKPADAGPRLLKTVKLTVGRKMIISHIYDIEEDYMLGFSGIPSFLIILKVITNLEE